MSKDGKDWTANIQVSVLYTGEAATDAQKTEIEDGIKNKWNQIYSSAVGKDIINISFIRVKSADKANYTINLYSLVTQTGIDRSNSCGGCSYMNLNLLEGNVGAVAAHEFGHSLGFYDRYNSQTMAPLKPEYSNDIMADGRFGSVRDKDIQTLRKQYGR